MSSFINKSECHKFLLEMAGQKWASGKFTRVAGDVFTFLDASLRSDMENLIRSHPTLGKTISMGTRKIVEEKC